LSLNYTTSNALSLKQLRYSVVTILERLFSFKIFSTQTFHRSVPFRLVYLRLLQSPNSLEKSLSFQLVSVFLKNI